jgi:hypothetical protein
MTVLLSSHDQKCKCVALNALAFLVLLLLLTLPTLLLLCLLLAICCCRSYLLRGFTSFNTQRCSDGVLHNEYHTTLHCMHAPIFDVPADASQPCLAL